MLSAATLNRVGQSYRRGYYDGHRLQPHNEPRSDVTFKAYDYEKGRNAGLNDRYRSEFTDKMSHVEFMRRYY